MAELDKEIADLEARVAKYETELDAATSGQEKSEIRQLLIHTRETHNRLLDEKKALSGVAASVGVGHPVYDFWAAVCTPDSVEMSDSKLKFRDGKTCWGWTKDVKELYVRECYKQAMVDLGQEDRRIAIVEGTPGIGKSLFIFYFIYEKVRFAIQNNERIPTFVISGRSRSAKKYLLRAEDPRNVVVLSPPSLQIVPDYLITDTIGDGDPSFNIQYLHVSSIYNENLREIRKLSPQIWTQCFPVFSYDEFVESDCGGSRDVVEKNFYYDVFGGNLRNIRSAYVKQIAPSDLYDAVLAEMNSFFGGYEVANVPEWTWFNTAMALASSFEHPKEGMQTTGEINARNRSVIIHCAPNEVNPNLWQDIPASKFMRHLAGRICDTSKKDALSRLRDAIGSSGEGFVHEHDAHQFRLAHLSKEPGIKIWSLHDKSTQSLYLPINRVVRIRTVKDIELLEEGDYGLPTVSNFPFVDAVINGHLFQDTIAQSHPSVAKIPEILNALNATDRTKTNLIFTLSNDNFDSFKMNNGKVMQPFSQWKTWMELHADDIPSMRQQEDIITEDIPMESQEESVRKGSKRKQRCCQNKY